MTEAERATIEALVQLLEPCTIDWEPRHRDQRWRPFQQPHKTGL